MFARRRCTGATRATTEVSAARRDTVSGPISPRQTRPRKGCRTSVRTVIGSNVACAASVHIVRRASGGTDDVSTMRRTVLRRPGSQGCGSAGIFPFMPVACR